MERMFAQIIDGTPPALVDLPTGAGKTELIIVWLLALAWYGLNRVEREPTPRRLVWVVNRRVLVQQVFVIAEELRGRLLSDVSADLNAVRDGLRAMSGGLDGFFRVVELRGQIMQDKDWAIRPTLPQLIIGTVDQIGSRPAFPRVRFREVGAASAGRPARRRFVGGRGRSALGSGFRAHPAAASQVLCVTC